VVWPVPAGGLAFRRLWETSGEGELLLRWDRPARSALPSFASASRAIAKPASRNDVLFTRQFSNSRSHID
jgi:hypothetical protein